MFDTLLYLRGEDFIIYFSVVCTLGSLFIWIINHISDTSENNPPPLPTKIHPYALAFLRAGKQAVLETACFNLYQHHVLTFQANNFGYKKLALTPNIPIPEHPIDQEIYHTLLVHQKPLAYLISDYALLKRIEPLLKPLQDELANAHLYRTDAQLRTLAWLKLIPFTILGMGATKLYFGLQHGKPIGFLVMVWIIFLIVFILLKPHAITRLGKKFVHAFPTHFGWMRRKFDTSEQLRGIDPCFAVAALGINILAYSVLFDEFQKQFNYSTSISNETSSGGSSGDSSNESSDGGSDGGGGGCGGCGGGD
jgi:uncharacterized protein (TIGR04222 family)